MKGFDYCIWKIYFYNQPSVGNKKADGCPPFSKIYFLVQAVPTYSPTRIVTIIKSLTAREVFARVPSIKKQLWGGEFWTDGYYVGTVGQPATEDVIRQYVKNQGQEKHYKQLHVQQLNLF